MDFFNFHYHGNPQYGIYNQDLYSVPTNTIYSAGLHPNDIDTDYENALVWVTARAQDKNCVAIGECGLDSFSSANPTLQNEIFKRQISIANQVDKPIIVHCVRRYAELLHFKKIANVAMVVHGFNKKEHIAKSLLEHGFYLSFGKSLLENLSLQSVFKDCPIDRFFLETDATNVNIRHIYEKAASIKALTLSEIEIQMKQNLNLVFKNE